MPQAFQSWGTECCQQLKAPLTESRVLGLAFMTREQGESTESCIEDRGVVQLFKDQRYTVKEILMDKTSKQVTVYLMMCLVLIKEK